MVLSKPFEAHPPVQQKLGSMRPPFCGPGVLEGEQGVMTPSCCPGTVKGTHPGSLQYEIDNPYPDYHYYLIHRPNEGPAVQE